jgi:hypothetical protein
MGLESVTFISSLDTSNPASGDARSQGDDHLRNIKTAVKASLPNADKAFYFPKGAAKTANYTILAADMNKIITADATGGAFNLTLPTLAAGDDGWSIFLIKTDASANAVTVVGTINGAANMALSSRYDAGLFMWDGSAWYNMVVPKSVLALVLTQISITGATALTAPAIDDELPIYDLSVTANRKITLANFFKTVGALTAETAIAADDLLVIYDTSAGAARAMTPANVIKAQPVRTIQRFTSGSGTYTTGAGARQLRVRMCAGGGGGGASATNNGSAGATTSFSDWTCLAGQGGGTSGVLSGGAGGTGGANGTGTLVQRFTGGAGQSGQGISGSSANAVGAQGGVNPFGGAGVGVANTTGLAAAANTGGGGGGGADGNVRAAGGGGAGEWVEFLINSPAASYSYAVGAGGNGGAAGISAGGNGAAGVIIVEEFY